MGGSVASRPNNAFIAYPGTPADLAGPITQAAQKLSSQGAEVVAWPALDIFGTNIPDEVRHAVEKADIVFADVTKPNLNVYYEIGYAIGLGKTISPIINASFANATASVRSLGLFSNIGYKQYENSHELIDIIKSATRNPLLDLYSQDINYSQPIYVVDTVRKTNFRNAVVSAVKASRSHFRSFDPIESARISVVQLIAEVSGSSGLVIPYLQPHIDDAERHNLRGALVAGMAFGLNRKVLLITDQHSEGSPTDYNDDIVVASDQSRIADAVSGFCSEAVLAAQEIPSVTRGRDRSLLQNLSLGASAAENEFRDLHTYFVETSEYLRAARGEINIITGRKGSGKSAIFFQIRDSSRARKGSLTVDLKPESHQLSTFREQIISTGGAGVFEHTIAAFWYFVCLSEMLLSIYRNLEVKSRYDGRWLAPMRDIEEIFEEYGILEPGDFTTRLTRLTTVIAREVREASKGGKSVSIQKVTNLVFRNGIGRIRDLIIEHTNSRYPITFVFDNIDKGWPATGVQKEDVTMVRLLVECLDKVRRDLSAKGRDLHSLVFIRHDVYDLMLDQTSDRGKSGQVSIDWTDRAKLAQVIYKRLQVTFSDRRSTMSELWHRAFPRTVFGEDSLDYFIDHSLMRPRFLINLIEGAVANGINRGHHVVSEQDCVDAVRQHSLALVDDFGFEMRDVSGVSAELLYGLIGLKQVETKSTICNSLRAGGYIDSDDDKVIDLMLWYGLIGVPGQENGDRYIYDYIYNMKRLKAAVAQGGDDPEFVINPALHVGLS